MGGGVDFADTLQRKSHLSIPFWELRGLSPDFHIHVSIFPGSVHIFPAAESADR
jgi:hypothetical protein